MPRTDFDQGRRVEDAIAAALATAPEGFLVRRNAHLRDVEADFLIETPNAETFLIEVKSGTSASSLGSVAQLARYRKAFRDERGTAVIAILVAVGRDAIALREVAEDFGIEVIAGDDVAEVADALTARLSA